MPSKGTAVTRDDDSDWTARHARLRPRERRPFVADADDREDTWDRRHAETKRTA
ncbi:hypothetical protein ACFQL1_12700 [Halomicroarcula sp. GCM10025709]|uniref:hypothetical protein n=1 Tax=Haloarcula TaxID=2237 RepID=UPI0024C36153|nr:hypothetical protein [Halomicroarcula sp. YJ-61-S]